MSHPIEARRTAPDRATDRVGLIHSRDLVAWQAWQAHQRPILQRLRHSGDAPVPSGVLTVGSSAADFLVALDGATPSISAALEAPCRFLEPTRIAVLDWRARPDLCGADATVHRMSKASEITERLPALNGGLTIGGHLPLGGLAHEALGQLGARCHVVQHGLLTPHAPPLPPDSDLLAWTDADGAYWASGRSDIDVNVVGSQLLWQAAAADQVTVESDSQPTFLGQLHAAELPRWDLARASIGFCRSTGARYRPHPSEHDKASRAFHMVMRASGVGFDTAEVPLRELTTPVVAIFSSGLLEAAAAGNAAWGYHPRPPVWIDAFWDRYGIARWGGEPTAPPIRPVSEPAEQIAQIVRKSQKANS